MDKIFEIETEEYLLAAGVSHKEINKIKFNKGKEGVLNTLQLIIDLIKNDLFDEVSDYTEYSPAGDDMGCDNHFIDFASIFTLETTTLDIIEACDILNQLKRQL